MAPCTHPGMKRLFRLKANNGLIKNTLHRRHNSNVKLPHLFVRSIYRHRSTFGLHLSVICRIYVYTPTAFTFPSIGQQMRNYVLKNDILQGEVQSCYAGKYQVKRLYLNMKSKHSQAGIKLRKKIRVTLPEYTSSSYHYVPKYKDHLYSTLMYKRSLYFGSWKYKDRLNSILMYNGPYISDHKNISTGCI